MTLTVEDTRREALDALLPAWAERRRRVSELGTAVKGLRGELQREKEQLGRTEADLDHVGGCRLAECLRCEELALNGAVG